MADASVQYYLINNSKNCNIDKENKKIYGKIYMPDE